MERLNDYRMKMGLTEFIVSAFLSMASVCSAVEYVWTQKADMPTPRWNLATCVMDGKVCAIGGGPTEDSGLDWTRSILEMYDPATDTWTRKANMPTPRSVLCASAVNGTVYAIGGNGSGASVVEAYDPITDTWTRMADMLMERRFPASCILNGKIYVIGGTGRGVYSGMKTMEVYDPATDTWVRKANMLTGVWGLCANVVNGKIYVLGGRPGYTAIRNVQEYDPATDTWTRKANMPIGTSQMASVVLGDKIVVIGGWLHSNNPPYTALQIYDPETDTWTIGDDTPFLRAAVSASVVNNRIYVIGGTDRPHPCPATSTVYELVINGPPPDFSADGIIDSLDVCIMVDHWGTDNSLCDIGPMPWGDGIVDVEDLKILAEHLFEEVNDATLIAHWPLDEAQGVIAYNNASDRDGTLVNGPLWLPDGGIVGGALQFDGIDDYVSTEFVLNPADPEISSGFSAVAWIQGGAPGQDVVSQANRASWLGADLTQGNLMTNLRSGRSSTPLLSRTCITDGDWHRVGFVWDGSYRHLYVDGVEVAVDGSPLSGLASAEEGLYLGAGSTLVPSTFFSGLIDDVRIYSRAVRP